MPTNSPLGSEIDSKPLGSWQLAGELKLVSIVCECSMFAFEIFMHVSMTLWVIGIVGLLAYYYYDEKKQRIKEKK